MLYSFNDADAAERHDLQYFEMFGNRGVYHRGWSAVTKHKRPRLVGGSCRPSTTTSGSCTTATDFTQAQNLAADDPEMLAKLQRLWLIEATKYNVLPLDDRSARGWIPDSRAGRRSSAATRRSSSRAWDASPRAAS